MLWIGDGDANRRGLRWYWIAAKATLAANRKLIRLSVFFDRSSATRRQREFGRVASRSSLNAYRVGGPGLAFPRACRGVSVLTALVVTMILGLVLSLGVPQYRDFRAQHELGAWIESFGTTLANAQDIARERRGNVALRPLAADAWSAQWCLRTPDSDGSCEPLDPFASDNAGTAFGLDQAEFMFDEIGAISPARWISFDLCHEGSEEGRRVNVSPVGRMRVELLRCLT